MPTVLIAPEDLVEQSPALVSKELTVNEGLKEETDMPCLENS